MNLSQIDLGQSVNALIDKLQGWMDGLLLMVPNLVLAVIVVLVAVGLSKLVGGLVNKAMNRATSYKTLNQLTSTIARTVVMAVGLFVALGVLGLDKTVTSLLAGAGVVGQILVQPTLQ